LQARAIPRWSALLKVAHDQGIVLIAAAGNGGPRSPPLYPGADPNVIAVTATDANDRLFARANRGGSIAVAAAGVDIQVPAPDSTFQLTSATSVASAEVSGVVALLLERHADLRGHSQDSHLDRDASHRQGPRRRLRLRPG
jgi:subtilisin family serine protease